MCLNKTAAFSFCDKIAKCTIFTHAGSMNKIFQATNIFRLPSDLGALAAFQLRYELPYLGLESGVQLLQLRLQFVRSHLSVAAATILWCRCLCRRPVHPCGATVPSDVNNYLGSGRKMTSCTQAFPREPAEDWPIHAAGASMADATISKALTKLGSQSRDTRTGAPARWDWYCRPPLFRKL